MNTFRTLMTFKIRDSIEREVPPFRGKAPFRSSCMAVQYALRDKGVLNFEESLKPCSRCFPFAIALSILMRFLSIAVSADPLPLARADFHSLEQQSQMEILVANLTDKSKFQDSEGNYEEIRLWRGLDLDEDENINGIHWSTFTEVFFPAGGEMDCQWIPASTRAFEVIGNRLTGEVCTWSLPKAMLEFDVTDNAFWGTIDVAGIPRDMQAWMLSNNKFHGELELEHLPPLIRNAYFDENNFSGSANLEKLPKSLLWLSLAKNRMTGSVNLSSLPAKMQGLMINENTFCGEVDLSSIPKDLKRLEIQKNTFAQETLVLGQIPEHIWSIKLWGNAFGRVVDENGDKINNMRVEVR